MDRFERLMARWNPFKRFPTTVPLVPRSDVYLAIPFVVCVLVVTIAYSYAIFTDPQTQWQVVSRQAEPHWRLIDGSASGSNYFREFIAVPTFRTAYLSLGNWELQYDSRDQLRWDYTAQTIPLESYHSLGPGGGRDASLLDQLTCRGSLKNIAMEGEKTPPINFEEAGNTSVNVNGPARLPVCFVPKGAAGGPAPHVAFFGDSSVMARLTNWGSEDATTYILLPSNVSKTVIVKLTIISQPGIYSKSRLMYPQGEISHEGMGCKATGALVTLAEGGVRCIRFVTAPEVTLVSQGMNIKVPFLTIFAFVGGVHGTLMILFSLLSRCFRCGNLQTKIVPDGPASRTQEVEMPT